MTTQFTNNASSLQNNNAEKISSPDEVKVNNSSSILSFPSDQSLLKPDPDPFPRYMFISLCFQGFGLTFALLSFLGIILLFLKPSPNMVQMADGTPISVKPFSNAYRSPENLKRFATMVAHGLFSWSFQVSQVDEYGQSTLVKDSGKEIEGDGRSLVIPTSVWKSGFWLSPDFRQPFLRRIGELIPNDISQGSEVYLQIRQVTDPIELSPGKWKVAVIADMVWNNPRIPPVEVNKVYYISLSQPSVLAGELTDFQQMMEELMRWGLVVTDIKDFKEEKNDFIH